MTEDELRAALRSRTDSAPATPGLAERAERAGRRQQTGARVAGAVALVAVMAVAAAAVLPRVTAQTPVPPATTSPSPSASATVDVAPVTDTRTVNGLSLSTSGPAKVVGTAVFEVEVTVSNPTATTWSGEVGVGLVYTAPVPGWSDGPIVLPAEPDSGGEPGQQLSGLTVYLPDDALFDGATTNAFVDLPAGSERSYTFQFKRDPETAVPADVRGWVGYAQRQGAQASPVQSWDTYAAVPISPAGSTLSCAQVEGISYEIGEPGRWGLDFVATTTVGADRKASWEEVPGVDAAGGQVVTSDQDANTRPTIVVKALQDAGGEAIPSAVGSERPEMPSTMDPGRYVAFSAVRMVDITFSGTCGPSGEPISGTWSAYQAKYSGWLGCAATQTAEPFIKATDYCPKP